MKEIHDLTESTIINADDYLAIDTGTITYKIKKSVLIPYITQPISKSDYDALQDPDNNTIYYIKKG